MLLCRGGFQKQILAKIFAHKERIHAGEAAANDAITLGSRQAYERFEACAEVIPASPDACRGVWNDKRKRGAQGSIIFNRHDAGPSGFDGLPHPVIIEIDIDGEQIYVADKTRLRQQGVYVFRCNHFFKQAETTAREEMGKMLPDTASGLAVRFYPQAVPAFNEQLGGIAFKAGLDAKFDKATITNADATEYLLEYSVFIVLRVNLETVA